MKKQKLSPPLSNPSPKSLKQKSTTVENSRKIARTEYQKMMEIEQPIMMNQPPAQERINNPTFSVLTEKERKAIELRERLKNLHHFYRIRIEEERSKNLERNEIFLNIIQQLQRSHNEKILMVQQNLEQMGQEKNEINYIDQRMGSIKSTIENILEQSKQLKISNQSYEREIMNKELVIKEKESHSLTLRTQIEELREKLEEFERLKLKQNRRNKELIEIIQNSF